MRTSENPAALLKSMAAARKEFPAVKKSGQNSHFNTRYATLDDLLTVAPVLAAHGVLIFHSYQRREDGAYLITRLAHESGEWLEVDWPLAPAQGSQGMGSANTYARRQSLANLLSVPTDEDDDGEAAEGRTVSRGTQKVKAAAPKPAGKRIDDITPDKIDVDDVPTARIFCTSYRDALLKASTAAAVQATIDACKPQRKKCEELEPKNIAWLDGVERKAFSQHEKAA